MEILKPRSTITEIKKKKSLDVLTNRGKTEKGQIDEIKIRSREMIQHEEQRGKKQLKKNKQFL